MGSLLNILWGNLCFDWFWSKPFIHMKLYGFCIDEKRFISSFVLHLTTNRLHINYSRTWPAQDCLTTSHYIASWPRLDHLVTTLWLPWTPLLVSRHHLQSLLMASCQPFAYLSTAYWPKCLTFSYLPFGHFMWSAKKIAITFRMWLWSKSID